PDQCAPARLATRRRDQCIEHGGRRHDVHGATAQGPATPQMTGVLFVAGLLLLVLGAELLVRGAARLAVAAGITPLVVGLTVVAYATSAPEAAVSIQAAFQHNADIAVGNVIGSNIFNVLMILGLSAVIAPLTVSTQLVRSDVPVMIGTSLLLLLVAWWCGFRPGVARLRVATRRGRSDVRVMRGPSLRLLRVA